MVAIVIGGFLEMLAIAAISPFISILLDSSIMHENQYIDFVFRSLGFNNTGSFLTFLAFLLAALYIFRGLYMIVLNRVRIHFVARRQVALSERLLKKLLGFSYLYHTHRNVAELQRIVTGDVYEFITMINGLLQSLSDFFMVLFILTFLLIVSPVMTLCIVTLSLLCVLLYFRIFRKEIRRSGEASRSANVGMTKALLQAFGGLKEIKVMHRESYFFRVFKSCSTAFVKATTHFRFIDSLPKIAIEIVCFGGAFTLLGFFIASGTEMSELVPQLSMFVLAAFRILPAISNQTKQINNVMYYRVTINSIYRNLFEEVDIAAEALPPKDDSTVDAITDSGQDIIVKNLSFKYPGANEPVLENVSFNVLANKSVAFIGSSGAGKTTLVDLILGVLSPDNGGVYFEGKSVHHHFSDWSKQIGYIPQHIYLLDESVLKNVAFGIDQALIDESKVWKALEQAQLKEFVESLPKGLNTLIGDRGVRLSGGQRQRIGIARAMYEDPPVLVLDEATSSLDDETEKAVMDAVIGFQGNKTMLIVAHRLSTIEHCDIVYRIDDKKVIREK